MKKLFTLVVTMMLGVASINCAQAQDSIAAPDTAAVVEQAEAAAPAAAATEVAEDAIEGTSAHQAIKQKFIEGGV